VNLGCPWDDSDGFYFCPRCKIFSKSFGKQFKQFLGEKLLKKILNHQSTNFDQTGKKMQN
jgi:hypothetical protein